MTEEIKQATEKVITEMLTESTGRHPMDSGGAYGRHWEENQKHIKKGKQPLYAYRYDKDKTAELIATIPIFDYLSLMEYTEDCQMLESLLPHLHLDVLQYIEDVIENPSNYDKILQVFEENQLFGSKVGNTYNNGEDLLSQGFQYIWFEYNGEDYIGISIHNGCDIRGGYTDIHIFKVQWSEEVYFAKSEAIIGCKCGMHNYWQSEVGYITYWDNNTEVNQKFVYAHSYEDEDGNLRCKYCNELITSEIRSI